jgi:hypothetical protein
MVSFQNKEQIMHFLRTNTLSPFLNDLWRQKMLLLNLMFMGLCIVNQCQ